MAWLYTVVSSFEIYLECRSLQPLPTVAQPFTNSRTFPYKTNNMDDNNHTTRDRKCFSISISWQSVGTIQGTQAASACIYPNIFSTTRGIHKQFTARSSRITRDRKSIFPHITASHGDLLAPYRCNKLFGQAHTPIFLAPHADYTTMYNETLGYNQGTESTFPHITASHLE